MCLGVLVEECLGYRQGLLGFGSSVEVLEDLCLCSEAVDVEPAMLLGRELGVSSGLLGSAPHVGRRLGRLPEFGVGYPENEQRTGQSGLDGVVERVCVGESLKPLLSLCDQRDGR